MSTNRGIVRLSFQDLSAYAGGKGNNIHPEIFGLEDGMKTTEGNSGQNGGCLGYDGKIYFPTLKGVAIVISRKKSVNKIIPPVKIETILADGQDFPPARKAILAAGTGRLEFHYAALSYVLPSKVKFKFILQGLDKNWVNAGNRREAYYTNIPPGEYTFRVIACNNDGLWNTKGASFSFYLQPFFYQTKLFYAVCILSLFLLAYIVYRQRVRQLKAREKHLTFLVAERTRELNIALEKVERLSLTDPLTQLPNRRNFEMVFAQEWKRCIRESYPLSLVMIDIDFFKGYNDNYGHPMGDYWKAIRVRSRF